MKRSSETPKKKKNTVTETEPRSSNGETQGVHARWVEDDREIDFSIQADDSYCQSEPSINGENDSTPPEETESELPRSETGQQTPICSGSGSRSNTPKKQRINEVLLEEEIERINRAMEKKLKELHELMAKQKMNKSAKMARECLGICEEQGLEQKDKEDAGKNNSNFNANVNAKANESEGTIYRRAVKQKRGSSSSEDEVNTSDEFLDSLNQLIISERAKVKAGEKPRFHDVTTDLSDGELNQLDYEDEEEQLDPCAVEE